MESNPSCLAFGVSKLAVGGYHHWVPENCSAVFLDRDGTLIEEKEYLSDPEGVELVPGVGLALRKLMDAGYRLVVVTNQAGIGRGYYTEADMHAVNERLIHLLEGDGVRLDGIYFAPEAPGQPSRGRKPKPQFLLDARDALGIRLEDSFMVGDKRSDLECGWNAGIRQSILVRTGYGSELEAQLGADAARTVVLDDMTAAAEWILHLRQSEM
jgi:D-glycero-D-manno-heptose 1,7-bisphosphate phosphatase